MDLEKVVEGVYSVKNRRFCSKPTRRIIFNRVKMFRLYELRRSDLKMAQVARTFMNFDLQCWCLGSFPELKRENFTEWTENTSYTDSENMCRPVK